jgi:predicted RNase H-like nuclease
VQVTDLQVPDLQVPDLQVPDLQVLGVDGCRGGWLAARLSGGDVTWTWTDGIAGLLELGLPTAVDIPIGLPDAGPRACDVAARAMLGRRGVSVFPAPVRAVLGCASYAEAREVLAGRGGPSMSAQAFGLVRAVRQVDDALAAGADARVVEAHPEVAFCRMGGGPGLASKKSTAGVAARLRLLLGWLPTALDALAEVPPRAALDDALDALACAWVARRWAAGVAQVLGDGSRDTRGRPMRIVA